MSEKIIKLYENSELGKEMGEEGYRHASANFSMDRCIGHIQSIYAKLV